MFWLRTVALVTVAGVAASLVLEGTPNLVGSLLLVAGFAVALAWWPWVRRLGPTPAFAVAVAQGLVAMAGQLVSGRPGTFLILFFVLVPTVVRLPRRYTLLFYTAMPLVACVPFLVGPGGAVGWSVVVTVVPGFLAAIAVSEAFVQYRRALEANQKLLDELIAAQKRSEAPGGPAATPTADPGTLTRRDRDVLGLVAMGYSNKEIAERLFLAEGTVKNRVSQILEKIGARDRTQAALRARERGLL